MVQARRSGAAGLLAALAIAGGGLHGAGVHGADRPGAEAVPAGCTDKPVLREGTAAAISAHRQRLGKQVLTFVGYSGAGYEDPAALRNTLVTILEDLSPERTVINAGATAEGIGLVYELARARGFATMGIVSSLARREKVAFSPCAQTVFVVADDSWGGLRANGSGLSPTSAAMVAASNAMVGIGGGAIAGDELTAARRAGLPVSFHAADMNHERARQKARRKGQPEPRSFSGAAADVLVDR